MKHYRSQQLKNSLNLLVPCTRFSLTIGDAIDYEIMHKPLDLCRQTHLTYNHRVHLLIRLSLMNFSIDAPEVLRVLTIDINYTVEIIQRTVLSVILNREKEGAGCHYCLMCRALFSEMPFYIFPSLGSFDFIL